jgi:Flp pilus assembly protein TadB
MATRSTSKKKWDGNDLWKKAQKDIEKQISGKLEKRVTKQLEEKLKGRMEKTQKQISKQVKGELTEQVTTELQKEISKQVSRRIDKILGDGFFRIQYGIQANRFLYGFVVITGILLFWYGAWKTIPRVPFISSGPVALGLGFFLLFISGALYYKLVGPSSKEK